MRARDARIPLIVGEHMREIEVSPLETKLGNHVRCKNLHDALRGRGSVLTGGKIRRHLCARKDTALG